jgi:hypothetical protein
MKTRNTAGQASCLSHSFPNRLLKQQSFKLETGWKPVLLVSGASALPERQRAKLLH